MPRRPASGAKISSVSWQKRLRLSAGSACAVWTLCSRSANLTRTTRISRAMAMNILRSVRNCASSRSARLNCVSLVTPSTRSAISAPEFVGKGLDVARRILHNVVEQGCAQCRLVHAHLGEQRRDREWMVDKRFARQPVLTVVARQRQRVGLANHLQGRGPPRTGDVVARALQDLVDRNRARIDQPGLLDFPKRYGQSSRFLEQADGYDAVRMSST